MSEPWQRTELLTVDMTDFWGYSVFLVEAPKGKQYIAIMFYEWRGKEKRFDYKRQLWFPVSKFRFFIEKMSQIEVLEDNTGDVK